MSAIRHFDGSRENIRHTGITMALVGLPVPTLSYNRWICILLLCIESFQLVNILSATGPKRKLHIQLGDGFCIQCVPFYLSYVITGRPTKEFCVTVHAPVTSLKVFISWTESWLLKVFYVISVTRALSRTSWMFVVKQVPLCNFILFIFACVVLRKVHVYSLFTLETVFAIFRLR